MKLSTILLLLSSSSAIQLASHDSDMDVETFNGNAAAKPKILSKHDYQPAEFLTEASKDKEEPRKQLGIEINR